MQLKSPDIAIFGKSDLEDNIGSAPESTMRIPLPALDARRYFDSSRLDILARGIGERLQRRFDSAEFCVPLRLKNINIQLVFYNRLFDLFLLIITIRRLSSI